MEYQFEVDDDVEVGECLMLNQAGKLVRWAPRPPFTTLITKARKGDKVWVDTLTGVARIRSDLDQAVAEKVADR